MVLSIAALSASLFKHYHNEFYGNNYHEQAVCVSDTQYL